MGQLAVSKGNLFHFTKSLYVDGSVFLYENKEVLKKAATTILDHLKNLVG